MDTSNVEKQLPFVSETWMWTLYQISYGIGRLHRNSTGVTNNINDLFYSSVPVKPWECDKLCWLHVQYKDPETGAAAFIFIIFFKNICSFPTMTGQNVDCEKRTYGEWATIIHTGSKMSHT